MNVQFSSILIALITTFIMISLLRPAAVRLKLTDQPNDRKLHNGSVPLIGGIAMFFGLIVSILVTSHDLNEFKYFLLASLIIVFIGVLDDYHDISISIRLLFQVLVAIVIVTAGGMNIASLGNLFGSGEIIITKWSYLISVVAIIAGINAVNMGDGLHGLAGGNSLVSFLAISYMSFNSAAQDSLLISLLFCAVLPVFLINNLCIGVSTKKRIFMGDAGSMLIGLSLAWVLLDFSQGEDQSFSPVIVLWLFSFPLIEIISTILRRLALGKSPFHSDLYHSHHLLLKLGFSEKKTLMIIILFSVIMVIIGILGERYLIAESLMFIGFLLVFLMYFLARGLALRKIKNIS